MVAFYGRRKIFSMSFLIPNFTEKGVKENAKTKSRKCDRFITS